MAILREHMHIYREIFSLAGFFAEPIATFGFQDVSLRFPRRGWKNLLKRLFRAAGGSAAQRALRAEVSQWVLRRVGRPRVPNDFRHSSLFEILREKGYQDLRAIDFFDERADLIHDMNLPIPRSHVERYGTFIDIGSIEHVFDTKQCLENCLRLVKTGGHYFVHTCVNGCFAHGLHVFNPASLIGSLTLNGFEVRYLKYSTVDGHLISEPWVGHDVLIWLVARKIDSMGDFRVPQQGNYVIAPSYL